MTVEGFERIAEEELNTLPHQFLGMVENVRIVVDTRPEGPRWRGKGGLLLGLYEGVPLSRRGTDYGMYPVIPDTITLYQANIEHFAGEDDAVRAVIRDTLIHEIGHHFGMSEEEIRRAGY